MHNTATPKPWKFEEEWAALNVAPLAMRRKVNMGEAAVVFMHVRAEILTIGSLLTGDALAPLGCEKVVITHQQMQDVSTEVLLIPKLPEEETEKNQREPSVSQPKKDKGPEGEDEEKEPMDHDLSAKKDEDKESVGKEGVESGLGLLR